MPRRFTEPTDDQIIAYLQTKSRALQEQNKLILPGNFSSRDRSRLEDWIANLPEQVLTDISTGSEDCVNFLRNNTRIIPLKEGEQQRYFLNIRYGLIPHNLLKDQQDAELDYNWYDEALSNDELRKSGFGDRWQMNLLLTNRNLPDKEEIYVLIRHQTHESRTLYLSMYPYSIDEVTDVASAVYSIFDRYDFERFYDISDKVLEKEALSPVIALHKMVQIDIERAKQRAELMKKLGNSRDGSRLTH